MQDESDEPLPPPPEDLKPAEEIERPAETDDGKANDVTKVTIIFSSQCKYDYGDLGSHVLKWMSWNIVKSRCQR